MTQQLDADGNAIMEDLSQPPQISGDLHGKRRSYNEHVRPELLMAKLRSKADFEIFFG